MTLPPFPSQDLAKLVLGYLAEEQLMTAYDEFLQASPYLDALRNEYDRIFMTSLKNIMAEYRAVKIYVETCKPFVLRKRLFQCTNLLDIVKFLVQNVDINKINAQDHNGEKPSFIRHTNVVGPSNVSQPSVQSTSQIEATTLESSVETTPLADLPGNVTTKKKSLKVLDKEAKNSQSTIHSEHYIEVGPKQFPEALRSTNLNNLPLEDNQSLTVSGNDQGTNYQYNEELIKSKKSESVQKIEEFNNILDFVCKNGSATSIMSYSVPDNVTNSQNRVSEAGTFQDFTTAGDKVDISLSNATEKFKNNTAQVPSSKDSCNKFVNIGSINSKDLKPHSHLILKVESTKNSQGIPVKTNVSPTFTQSKNTVSQINTLSQINTQKREESKIKILSDVKVDKSYDSVCGITKMPSVLNNATSTPLVQMQTILINGTPAFKNKTQCAQDYNYTKDEIMAMPTIILVPASGTSANSTDSQPIVTFSRNTSACNKQYTKTNVTTDSINSKHSILKPLVIDVPSDVTASNLSCNKESTNKQNIEQTMLNEQSLIKTVEVTGHVSVPKDNTLSTAAKTCTPQGLPPIRKSSSTPRRNSHIRVLDFTTPRRILHETINELSSNKISFNEIANSETLNAPCIESSEVDNAVVTEKISNIDSVDCSISNSGPAKENKVVVNKKSNWDADLRALAVNLIDNPIKPPQKLKHKTKSKITKKKNSNEIKPNKVISVNAKSEKKTKKVLHKEKSNKNKSNTDIIPKEIEDVIYISEEKVSVALKPTINIITGNEWSTNNQENDKNQSKSTTNNDSIDTPESERIALQNVIGAKLNISDLLETPYKQALYDIQMETPKFLGPDLPGEPISEVKIMNIPTPRFLCSPKGAQATPSSYCSRPTDYSSGGSYYKPDDQDYILSTEVLECSISAEENFEKNQNIEIKCKKRDLYSENNNTELKSSRPVRQCRKNVSYYKNQNTSSKFKETEDNSENSDAPSINSSFDNKSDNQVTSKNSKDISITKPKKKPDSNRRISSLKKIKTPLKRDSPKTFMKIKPRRTTPIKETIGVKSRKISDSSQNKQQKRTFSKDRNVNSTPVASPAPTKSRRKSSTPRKLHCTKSFISESSSHESPETTKLEQEISQNNLVSSQDSDIEQLPLRWSDDGSQDGKSKENQLKLECVNDTDDISKIKEYIETSTTDKFARNKDGEGCLHIDLIKRGFDVETAKIIERDLLDSPQAKQETDLYAVTLEHIEGKNRESLKENSVKSVCHQLTVTTVNQENDDDEEIELSIHECNEDTINYVKHQYEDSSCKSQEQPSTLKNKFSMEVCIEDGVTVRLRATPFSVLLDQDPQDIDMNEYCKETEIAVSSISNIDKLYTPIKAQVYEIFDSTLTSLDTPLKLNSPKSKDGDIIVTEIALEVEKVEYKEKSEIKKRKRQQSSGGTALDESTNSSKRAKPETQYLLNTANIQNIDIESVLSKLHGP